MFYNEYIEQLKNSIIKQGQGTSLALKAAYSDLSQRYRSTNTSGFENSAEIIAYIQARFPATYSVVHHILENEINNITSFKSLLDLGAGPGTATLAALDHFEFNTITLIEQTEELLKAVNDVLVPMYPNVSFSLQSESVHSANLPKADLVVLSYLLTEMSENKALRVYEASLKATNLYNLVVLPGTSAAFKLLLALRDRAISLGYSILAPCPHMQRCPLVQEGDQWCHFKQRLNRSRVHQEIKKGTIGYEDEPYCYLLVAPKDASKKIVNYDRVIHTPKPRPGHIYVDICAQSGEIKTQCITKKDKIKFKATKDLKWGDRF